MTSDKIQHQINKIKTALITGEKSTSELAFRTGLNFYQVEARLENLVEVGEVEKKIYPRGTYWKLKEESLGGIAA